MSKHSISKCKRAINYLLLNATNKTNPAVINWQSVKFRMAFITLTLSAKQIHSDNIIKRELLNPFLIEIKRQHDVQNYVWRAERQQNGNIHFHLLVDKFLPWHEVRGLWNHLQAKLGYIRAYQQSMREYHRNGFKIRADLLAKWPLKDQLKAYSQGKACGWRNPNSTDIHSVKFISNVAAYVTKYMTKESKLAKKQVTRYELGLQPRDKSISLHLSANTLKYLNQQAQIGRLWSCSVQLTSLTGGQSLIDSSLQKEIDKIAAHPSVKKYDDGYCLILCSPIQLAIKLHCITIVHLLSEFMCERFVLT
jgi:hypothetical protein